jgi:SAM-dependent methyltransferase
MRYRQLDYVRTLADWRPTLARYLPRASGGPRLQWTARRDPSDAQIRRYVLAVEPSAGMRAQRPAHFAPAIDAGAEALPLDDDACDAAMAIITLHHWRDPAASLRELRRVARGPVVVLTFDTDMLAGYWMISETTSLRRSQTTAAASR